MDSWGFIETIGYIPAIAAADAMLKAANIQIMGRELIGGAMLTVAVRGEIGAVRTAVDAGATAAKQSGELVCAHVIAKPTEGTEKILNIDMNRVG